MDNWYVHSKFELYLSLLTEMQLSSYKASPIKGCPSCRARFQMHWYSKILLNCHPVERSPSYKVIISLQKDGLDLYYTWIFCSKIISSFGYNTTRFDCLFYNIRCYFFQNGWSPLLVASEQGHINIVKILLQHHARVDVFDEVS